MNYKCGKRRVAQEITDVLLPYARQRTGYAEPFAGMFSVGTTLLSSLSPRQIMTVTIADANPAVTGLWRALLQGAGWLPRPTPLTQKAYMRLKRQSLRRLGEQRELSPQALFYGWALSFRGVFFGSNFPNPYYNRRPQLQHIVGRLRNERDRILHGTGGGCRNVAVKTQSYQRLEVRNTVIYCDPPYETAGQYSWTVEDEEAFWTHVASVWLSPPAMNVVFVSAMSTSGVPLAGRVGLRVRQVWKRELAGRGVHAHVRRWEYLFHVTLRSAPYWNPFFGDCFIGQGWSGDTWLYGCVVVDM